MLVPGIHSDSKIKLQEEVCTRNKGPSDWRTFGISFFLSEFKVYSLSWSPFIPFDFVGIKVSCLGFSLALRRRSLSPLNMAPSAVDTIR